MGGSLLSKHLELLHKRIGYDISFHALTPHDLHVVSICIPRDLSWSKTANAPASALHTKCRILGVV